MTTSKRDRGFMEAAVEEMLKSRTEHEDKPDPRVGAVLVDKDGNELGRTHRGALRDGNHAEYTLIERMHGDKSLEGATMFVTLEPCVRRTSAKKPCAEWIVEARISRAFVGMIDPNPNISGRGVQHLLNHGVEVDFFDINLVHQVREANQGFIDYYEAPERRAIAETERFEGPSPQELGIVERSALDDLSHDAIKRYLDQREMDIAVPSDDLWKMLEGAGYVGRTTEGKLSPTVAGIALFAASPAEILPQCRVSIEARKAGRTVSGDFEGPLIAFRDHIDAFFKDNMRHFTEIREFERVAVGEYPAEALREVAFNAVIHRDYQGGARVHIILKESGVEVKSPGGLLKPLSLSRVRAFNAPPYSRNPHIAVAVHRMGWIEEKGSGLGRMRDAMIEHGLRPPHFDIRDGYFIVTLPGQEQAWSNIRVAPELLATLAETQQRIIELLLAKGRLATKDCARELNVGSATARRHLKILMDKGLLESRGKGPSLTYHLAGSE